MYIMSNNNPEEIYLQRKRIDEEETFLSKDIKRQQKEIDKLIDEKVKEMKNTNIIKNQNQKSEKEENKKDNKPKRLLTKESIKKKKNEKKKQEKKKGTLQEVLFEVEKLVKNIDSEIVELTIDNTQKFIKEKSSNLSRMMKQPKDNNEIIKEGNKNNGLNFEDLEYEKEIKLKEEEDKRIKEHFLKKKESHEIMSKLKKKRNLNMSSMQKTIKNTIDNQIDLNKSIISNELSFYDDLNIPKFKETDKISKKATTINQVNSYIIDFDLNNRKNKEKKENDKESLSISSKESNISNKDNIISKSKNIKLKGKEDMYSKVQFNKPYSILTSVINLIKEKEIQEKLQKMRENFKLEKYLEKETKKGVNVDFLGRRKSFLDFMQHAQKNKDLNEYLENKNEINEKIILNALNKENKTDDNNQSQNSISKIEDYKNLEESSSKIEIDDKKNVSFLSADSNLTIGDNISLDDINIIPNEIKENNIFVNATISKDNLKKNMQQNKLQNFIRNSFFDRNAVNINTNLTSKELSKYYKVVNKNLNKNLFSDLSEPRRRKSVNNNVSFVRGKRNYCHVLAESSEKDDDYNNNNNIKEKKDEKVDEIIYQETERYNLKTVTNTETNMLNKSNNERNKEKFDDLKNDNLLKNELKKSKKKGFYIFKAKSIDKNYIKYPLENSNDFLVPEENKPYNDPLTIRQESISDNLRGKRFYMNYLYNILDKDLKVKDTFDVRRWEREIHGRKDKYIKLRPLPERVDAFFVFNDKKLNLKKYEYQYHQDLIFEDNEFSVLTHNLKFLPNNVLQLLPMRLRNFGKFFAGQEIIVGSLGNKTNSMNLMKFGTKTQALSSNSRSGKKSSQIMKNKSELIISSSYANNLKVQEDIKINRGLFEKIYKNINTLNYRSLSHYFLKEDELIDQFLDSRKKEEKMKRILEYNKAKENRLEVKSEIVSIELFDYKSNSRRYMLWSGSDVLSSLEEDAHRKRWNNMIESLENFNFIIWNSNKAMKNIQKIRYAFYLIATNDIFDYIILLVVLANTVFMAIDGNILKPETLNNLNVSNYVFNGLYMFEYLVKFIGLGPIIYYSDGFTYLDTFIIVFSIVDMASPSQVDTDSISGSKKKNVSSELGFLRVFRIFRVVRLTKVLRRFKSMRLIIVSLTKAILNVSYIIIIVVMFILIFQLLGMSLLSGNRHYQSFLESFYATYQILTLESWNELLIEIWPMNYLCFFYFLAWIILGNFVLFNLFISVLLQSFSSGEGENEKDLTDDEKVEKMFTLPDYLYSIKQSKKNSTASEKVKRTKQILNFDAFQNQNSKSQYQNSLGKSQTGYTTIYNSRSNIKSIINNSESNINESLGRTEEDDDNDFEDNYTNDNYLTMIEHKIKDWKRVNKIFRRNECENSLYLFSQTNHFRCFCMKLIVNKWFDRIILIVILLSTARLIIDTFLKGYTFVLIFDIVDAIFNIIFFLEAVIKIISMGLILDEGSYLRDNWNKIDIIIVLCSIFDFQNLFTKYVGGGSSSSSLKFLKVLRLLRTLRPLRFISHNIHLKLIITSLFESIIPILTALGIVIISYYIFSIVGISIFYNSFHNCYVMNSNGSFKLAIHSFEDNLVDYQINNDQDSISTFCSEKYNGIMDTGPTFQYSNIISGIITSYVLSTQEAWPDIMNSYKIYSDMYGFFFVAYNLVVSYFVLNLFTGIMFRYFNEAYKKETKVAEDDKKAQKYYDFLTQVYTANSNYVIWVHPKKGTFKYYLREFVDSSFFDNFIMIIIGLNMITMAMHFENNPPLYDKILNYANYVFTVIFILECILKIFAYGVIGYFYLGWNRFDFFVVVASIIDFIIANIDGIDAAFLKSFQIIRVLRVLRVTRVLRLVKSLKGLEKLIQTLSWSIGALFNVIILMIIIFSIFAILGVYLYDDIIYENYKNKFYVINEYYNLDNFYTAFLFVFRCATGEKWPYMMNELAFVDLNLAPEAYAYIFMIIGNFFNGIIMINLFLIVTLQQYDEFTSKNYNPIEKFESFLADFNNAWNKYSTPEDKGFRIKKSFAINFFMDFNWKKLNFPEQQKLEHVKKYVWELKLTTDDNDNVYYLDIIYKVLVKQMGSQIDRNNPNNLLIFKTEKKVENEVKEIINDYINSHQNNYMKKRGQMIIFNPYTSHLYFRISYMYLKAFVNIYKENSELIKHYDNEGEIQNINDNEKGNKN